MFQIITVLAGVLLVAADQLTKRWAVQVLQPVGSMDAVPGVFQYTFLPNGNDGAAWGMFSGKQTFLIAITVIMLGILLYMLIAKKVKGRLAFCSLVLIIAGGVGNLIDRISQHYVVDFIQLVFWKNFPIFNLADCCVCIGVILLCIYILFFDRKKKESML